MKKDDKLRTVNKWNRGAIEENLFWPGGEVRTSQPQMPIVDWSDPMQRRIATSISGAMTNTFNKN